MHDALDDRTGTMQNEMENHKKVKMYHKGTYA